MVKFKIELGNVLDAQARFSATGDAEVIFSAARGLLMLEDGLKLPLEASGAALTFFDGKQVEAAVLGIGEGAVHILQFAVWLPRRTITHLLNALSVSHRRLLVTGDLLEGNRLPGRRTRYDTILLRSLASTRSQGAEATFSVVGSCAERETGSSGDRMKMRSIAPEDMP